MEQWKIKLTKARERKFPVKAHFARAVGVSSATVTDWEKSAEDGGIKELTGRNLTKVCEVLDITPKHLLEDNKYPHKGTYDGGRTENWGLDEAVELLTRFKGTASPGREKILEFVRITEKEFPASSSSKTGRDQL